MSRVILLGLTMVLSILYLALPYSDKMYDFFTLADQQLSLQMHVWFVLNKFTFVILAYIIWKESTTFITTTKVFYWIMIVKLIDYMICYNSVWFNIGSIPVTSTTTGFLVFGLVLAWEYLWKDRQ